MRIPERLAARLASEPDTGSHWIAALPATVDRLARRWELQVIQPLEPGGVTSVVLPGRRADGTAVVLKVPFLDDEVAPEAAGLALVDGDGAVRLLEHDPDSGALLLEAAVADRSLLDLPDAERATSVVADLLQRWWRPVPPESAGSAIPRLADVATGLADELRRRKPWLEREVEAPIIDRALATLGDADPSAATLLHTDLHQGNALAAKREPWLIIDPKPLAGERAYDLEPLLRDHRVEPPSAAAIRRRFDATSAQLGLDRARAMEWVIARSVLLGSWSLEVGDGFGSRQLGVAVALAD